MKMSVRLIVLGIVMSGVVLWAPGSHAVAQASDPIVGNWKLNIAKSKFTPGPPSKSITVKFETAGQGVKVTADTVAADGSSEHTVYTANYDGKDYPITGSAVADTVSLKRIDATSTERTDKKGGKVVQTYTRKVSNDGKVLTVIQKGTNTQGQFNNTLIFDKT